MATVLLSNQVRNTLIKNAAEKYTPLREKLLGEIPREQLSRQFMERVFPDNVLKVIKYLKNLDNDWIKELHELMFYFPITTDKTDLPQHYQLQIPFPNGIPGPSEWRYARVQMDEVFKSLPCYKEVSDILVKVIVLEKEANELRNKLSDMIDSYRTLKQLLEVWPSAIEFLDEKTRERHMTKETRSSASKPEIDDRTKTLLAKVNML